MPSLRSSSLAKPLAAADTLLAHCSTDKPIVRAKLELAMIMAGRRPLPGQGNAYRSSLLGLTLIGPVPVIR